MRFALNYSPQAEELLKQGKIQLDCFKCPAWPDLINEIGDRQSVYIHFPLKVGLGIGDAMDGETTKPADWNKVETLLKQTGTRFVNLHLVPDVADYPDIPVDTTDPAHLELLLENTLRDVTLVVRRFGAERVMVENDYSSGKTHHRPAYTPEFIRRVVEEAGCGFLLDLAHARIASGELGMDWREYISSLPVRHIREIHLAGIQFFGDHWVQVMQAAGVDPALIQWFSGRLTDHLPMTEGDFALVAWAVEQLQKGSWQMPEIMALEYGGVGKLWQAMTDPAVLKEQIPRLYQALQPLLQDASQIEKETSTK